MIGRTGSYPSTLTTKGTGRVTRAQTFERFAAVVGGRLRDARVEHGLSLFELARAADVPATTLRAIETGERHASLLVLFRVARAIGVDARELMP